MQLEKFIQTCVLLALTFTGCARAATNPVAAQYHYAGLAPLTDNAELTTLHKVFALTNSAKFHDAIISSLSELLPTTLALNAGGADPALLHPILEDLSRAESVGNFSDSTKGPLQFVIAIHLEKSRAELWKDNLKKLSLPASFHVEQEGDWLVVGQGDDLLPLQNSYLNKIRKDNRPVPMLKTNWFEADVDWVRMAPLLSLTNCPLKLARTIVSIATAGDNFRTTAQIIYPGAIETKSEPWKFPIATVSEPLISFTATRGVTPLLNISPDFAPYVRDPFSHQVFVWALGDMVLQTYAVTPVEGPTNLMRTVYTNMLATFNPTLKIKHQGELGWVSNRNEVNWGNLGMLSPYLRPLHEKTGDYLVAGLFPLPPKPKPAPVELWKEIEGIKDLVYYDWEAIGPRLQQWRLLGQMLPILPHTSRTKPTKPDQATVKDHSAVTAHPVIVRENWLGDLSFLGEGVTQVTRTGPGEFSLLRKSQLGFTGLELIFFSHWLSGTGTGPFNTQLFPPKAKASGPGH